MTSGVWMMHRPGHADLLSASELRHRPAGDLLREVLIVRSTGQMGCEILCTEDLNHGPRYGGITVRNPFREGLLARVYGI